MVKNTLQIRARALDLELTGDATYVEEAYMAMRHVVMERFRSTLHQDQSVANRSAPRPVEAGARGAKTPAGQALAAESEGAEAEEPAKSSRERQDTNPMYKAIRDKIPQGVPETTLDAAETPLHTVSVGNVYNSVCIVARRELDQSIFGRTLSARLIERIYINDSEREGLERHITFGKVLWRELTVAGQSAIGRRDGEP